MRICDTRPMKVIVFARAPIAGRCKTRLIPRLGAQGAAALHRRLVRRTLLAACGSGLVTELWCAPDAAHGFFARCRREFGVRLHRQCRGNLGDRMAHALARALRDASGVILIGTDCIDLGPQDLRDAAQALDRFDVVLQPARDGGYVLIGARRIAPVALRGVRWSSGQELTQTRARLRRANLRWHELPSRRDLDTPADYRAAVKSGMLESRS